MIHFTDDQLLEILIAFAGAVLAGWLVKRFVFPFLFKLTHKTKWKSDDLVIESVAQWVIFWFVLGAFLYVMPMLKAGITFVETNEKHVRNGLAGLFIFSLTVVTARVVSGMLQIRSQQTDSEVPSTSILTNIIRAIIYCIGLILILNKFGVEIAPLVTALGVGGLAVALALQPTLSNLFSGLQIIASGKLNIGDFVQLEGGQKGFIRDITWRNTTIETAQNNVVIIPNSKMADSIVENFFLVDREITFNVLVGVSYDSDLAKVEKLSIEVAKEILASHQGGVVSFEPFVRFYNFGESSIDLKVFLRVTEYANQFLITSEFIKALHKRYNEEGINIPFPIRTVFLNNQQ